ncbi:MAG: SDR family oxidoreductase [Oceanospirillales bacterium]|uniref:NAD(P)-dependent dehydrogenase (Short-subunit alcohol dehydrogenase family) n=1 Tax=Marinobacterium halophilum TaxID=267374 RepID=A0A2P8EMZ3_9GAMM|nr:SDR family oxidoreductase [Marinobacterium halophilum]MBR9828467.1 SDR family oxidoreductase [Oceanospirillales bacterium]PSL10844.1 NAD(P)-dependent dehydrogenase (short-subunit alcohol dehydrogenase family) [Marinobacterium halophilum]
MTGSVSFDFTGKVVLITGGTKGIGAGIANSFLSAGADVIICGRTAPEQMPSAGGRDAVFVQLDVRDYEAAEAVLQRIIDDYGRLDVLVNNAGGAPHALAGEVSPRFHEGILRLNLIAPLHLAQLANRHMQAQDVGGCIIFIGSISAFRASPGSAAYGAAKAGVVSLAASLAVEWAPKVRVVAVSPGLIETEQSHLHYGDSAGIQAVADTIPAGRLGRPEDIGNACLYMASPLASYASGSNLLLNGGGERPAFLQASTVTN